MRYEYWVVRYVPDSIRGEYVNVAVIAGNEHQWAFRRVDSLRRAARLGGSAAEATSEFFDRLEDSISQEMDGLQAEIPLEGQRHFSRGDVEDRRGRMRNTIQLSAPRPVLADTAQQAVDIAFGLMVVDVPEEPQHRSTTLIKRELKNLFIRSNVLRERYLERPVASLGARKFNVDFAVRNSVVRQLTNVWTFDLGGKGALSRQAGSIGSMNFNLLCIRGDGSGATLSAKGRRASSFHVPREVKSYAVFKAPETAEQRTFFDDAMDGWRQTQTIAVESTDADRVIREAEELLVLH